jgi:hypothetical protein
MNSHARKTHLDGWGDRNEIDRPEEPRQPYGKKDTRRWCRGRVGVEHKKAWFHGRWNWNELRCTVCRRRFDWCFWRAWLAGNPGAGEDKCICGLHVPKPTPAQMDALHVEAKREHYAATRAARWKR